MQLVLLDHGLYRDLPRAFALTYSRLWHGVVLGDADAIREAAEEMGVGQYYPLLAAMLTARPWTDILRAGDTGDARALHEKGTAADKKQIAGYAAQYAKHIGIVLDLVPRPLLLLFKTNDCLRHAERQLGAAGVGSFSITLRYCLCCLRHEARAAAAAASAASTATTAATSTGSAGSTAGVAARRWLGIARAWLAVLRLDVAMLLLRVLSGSAVLPRAVRALSLSPASAKRQGEREKASTSAVSVEHT